MIMRVKFLAPRYRVPLELVAFLCLGGASWLLQSAIAPLVVRANTERVDLTISRQFGESYETMLLRAEADARTATQLSLNRNSLVTDVAVSVLAENQGAIAPIISLQVSRQAWQNLPNVKRWATYFPSTQALLRLTNDVQIINQPAFSQTPEKPTTTAPGTNTPQVAPGTPQTPTPGNTAPGSQQPATIPTNTLPSPARGTPTLNPTDPRRLPTLESPPPPSPSPGVNTNP